MLYLLKRMAEIRIPPVLRPETEGRRTVTVGAVTVLAALEELVSSYPTLRERVLEGDQVPSFLNVFVDGEDIRLLQGLETELRTESEILLLPAVAGG